VLWKELQASFKQSFFKEENHHYQEKELLRVLLVKNFPDFPCFPQEKFKGRIPDQDSPPFQRRVMGGNQLKKFGPFLKHPKGCGKTCGAKKKLRGEAF